MNTDIEHSQSVADSARDATGAQQAELAAQKDRYLQLAADFDNYRKRTAQEADRAWKDWVNAKDAAPRSMPDVFDRSSVRGAREVDRTNGWDRRMGGERGFHAAILRDGNHADGAGLATARAECVPRRDIGRRLRA